MVGGLNKNVGHHVWSTAEIKKKKHWLKRPRTVPPKKRSLDQNKNDSKSYIWNSFFENIHLHPHVSVDIIKLFLVSDFLAESLKDRSFYNTVSLKNTSLILRTSTHLTLKVLCSRNTANNLSHFTNVRANLFLVGVRKNICTARFLDTQELHL